MPNETVDDQITSAVTNAVTEQYTDAHYVTSWVLVAEVIGPDGQPEPFTMQSDATSWVNTLGLLEAGRLMYQAEFMGDEE